MHLVKQFETIISNIKSMFKWTGDSQSLSYYITDIAKRQSHHTDPLNVCGMWSTTR